MVGNNCRLSSTFSSLLHGSFFRGDIMSLVQCAESNTWLHRAYVTVYFEMTAALLIQICSGAVWILTIYNLIK